MSARLLRLLRSAPLALVVSYVLAAAGSPAGGFDALPAQVVPFDPPVSVEAFGTVDFGATDDPSDDRSGFTKWRVVEGSGNCCENYLTITAGGRLLDVGGRYIHFSDDRGQSWSRVQPLLPLVNGEGAIVVAPGGDVLGVEWDPYSGDHLQFYKYEADTGAWRYTEMPVHTPFYDREWIAVVPGPVTVDGSTHEYVSFVKGGWPSKEVWFYSTDGLHYHRVTSKAVEQLLEPEIVSVLPTARNPESDWIQPNTNTLITQLGRSHALAAPDFPFATWSLFDGGLFRWSPFRYRVAPTREGPQSEGTRPTGLFQVDSGGRVHNVNTAADGRSFEYRLSPNGGKSWKSVTVTLPDSYEVEEIDFRAHRAAGVAAVGMRAQHEVTATDQDLLYKLDITTERPRLVRFYRVGRGDLGSTAGVGNDIRFDFETVAIFADGRVAMSFLDSTTTMAHPVHGLERFSPAIAIELDTRVGA